MQGLIFTAEQTRLVLAGELDVVYHPMTREVGEGGFLEKTQSFAHASRGSKYWAALAADGYTPLGTVVAPFVADERVFLAEPWSPFGGGPQGIAYEADHHPLPPKRFWAAPHLMPWNASRQQLVVLEIHPSQGSPLDFRPSVGPVDVDWHIFYTGRIVHRQHHWLWRIKFALVPSVHDALVQPQQQQHKEKKRHG